MSEITPCFIYRSSKKEECYIFLPEQDAFDDIPAEVMKGFGTPEFVMELPLEPERKLARTTTEEVLANFERHGFHLQLPPTDPVVEQQIQNLLGQ